MTTCPLLWSQISLKERLKALEHVLHRADVLNQRVTHCSSWSWLLSFIRSPVKIKGWNSWNRNRLEKKWKGKAIDPFCSILLLSSPFHFLFSSFPFPWAESCLKARLSKRNVVAAKLWLPVHVFASICLMVSTVRGHAPSAPEESTYWSQVLFRIYMKTSTGDHENHRWPFCSSLQTTPFASCFLGALRLWATHWQHDHLVIFHHQHLSSQWSSLDLSLFHRLCDHLKTHHSAQR